MTTRILPPDEWSRLAHTEAGPALAYLDPAESRIVVVEDSDRIVGCWAVLRLVHVEGLWIDPAYRKGSSVARRLFQATWRIVRAWAPRWVMTAAVTDDVKALLREHVGAVAIPGEMFVVAVNGAETCRLQG
jgi:hypothetical protein